MQIEKEMHPIVYLLSKFHQYTFGRHTTVLADHKLLQTIMRKQLDELPKKLQGILLQTQHYSIDIQN